jgi:hypothetical protein
VRFQVLTAASMMFRAVFWVILPCKMIVDRRFRGAYCLHPCTALIPEMYYQNMIASSSVLQTYYVTYYTTNIFIYRESTIIRAPRAYKDFLVHVIGVRQCLWTAVTNCSSSRWLAIMTMDSRGIKTGKTEELKHLSHRHFMHYKSRTERPEREPGPPRWDVGD